MKQTARYILDNEKLSYGLRTVLVLSPLFLLTVKGWISGVLLVSGALAILILWMDFKHDVPIFPKDNPWLWGFVILFGLPVVAIFLGQSGRLDYVGRDYDSPARFLLCIPILLVLFQRRLDVVRWLVYAMPVTIFLTYIAITLNSNNVWQPQTPYRASTYFADPLTFGSVNLTLGLCCLLSIDLYGRDDWRIRIYKGAGFIVGVYLSVSSGSRTGWLALPVVLVLWVQRRMTRYRIPLLLSVLLVAGGSYSVSTTLQQRLDLAGQEIMSYRWNALNVQTSVGDRLSFLRIAAFVFTQRPWFGVGDQGISEFINHPDLNQYALRETQEWALRSGFHNEIATNMVRSGVWGLLASSALFAMPAVFFLRSLYATSPQIKKIALLALGYLVCTFVSGMTTEVFNLKFTASFHALMFTCFISSLLVHHAVGEGTERNESP